MSSADIGTITKVAFVSGGHAHSYRREVQSAAVSSIEMRVGIKLSRREEQLSYGGEEVYPG